MPLQSLEPSFEGDAVCRHLIGCEFPDPSRTERDRPLSRAGEGWGEGPGFSGEVAPLTLSLSRTGEGTRASSWHASPSVDRKTYSLSG
ncbi:hypothetical protein SAMN05192568_1002141 [Methylobacterium pseudosasicola]|uniref:Uncharacterized protein n=1 Tax=Methylobacterium pseudosasicola TaxID=582667 RepID=A0A1I4G178_9HYPH|nr:hypothetical protein SAMN05192568_1002141 [Methylobacterium pseudosasicola]